MLFLTRACPSRPPRAPVVHARPASTPMSAPLYGAASNFTARALFIDVPIPLWRPEIIIRPFSSYEKSVPNEFKPIETSQGGFFKLAIVALAGVALGGAYLINDTLKKERAVKQALKNFSKTDANELDQGKWARIIAQYGSKSDILTLLAFEDSKQLWTQIDIIHALGKRGNLALVKDIFPLLNSELFQNDTILKLSIKSFSLDIVKLMFKLGSFKDPYLLRYALIKRRYDIADFLVENGWDIKRSPPLLLACEDDDSKLLSKILELGASPNYKDVYNKHTTLTEYCLVNNKHKCLEVLLNHPKTNLTKFNRERYS